MKKIAENILIETDYLGVTLGAVVEEENVMFVDAPLLPENVRVWRNQSTKKKKLAMKVALLDSHPDRAIGSRYFESSIIAHDEVMRIYLNRPITFKPISQNSGSDWETIKGMNGFRWAYPEIVFSQKMDFHQEKLHIIPEYHPGASVGASWLSVPERKVLFIGDCLLTDHAPFLGLADIPLWLDTLEELKAEKYSDTILVSGRSGIVTQKDIEPMEEFLRDVGSLIAEYAEDHEDPIEIGKIVEKLKPEKYFSIPKAKSAVAEERLLYGVTRYFMRHYMKIEEQTDNSEGTAETDGEAEETA